MANKLAIVIPAYRQRFLRQTLDSIAAQTDKRFTVYIGDDASPEDLAAVVAEYEGQMDIHYHRFAANLGASDLVGQWTRCLALTSEEWIWLFSDDDTMDRDCVSAFYSARLRGRDILRFNIDVIDAEGKVLERCDFPSKMSSREFARNRFRGRIRSYAVEYIFRRSAFEDAGGFVNFDLAWCSDDATWMMIARKKGIRTIPGPRVQWRRSGSNITSVLDAASSERKLDASIKFISWCRENIGRMQSMLPWFVTSLYHSRDNFSREQITEYMRLFASAFGGGVLTLMRERCYYLAKKIKRRG